MYKEKLIPIADLITPNTFEAEWVPYLLFAWLSIFNYYSMFLVYFVQKTDWNYNRDWRRCNEGIQCFSNSWLILDFVTGNRQAALLWTKDGIPYQYAAWDKTWCACNSRQEPEGYEYVELHILKPACKVVCMLCYVLLVKYNCVITGEYARVEMPRIPALFTGTGDMFCALLLAWSCEPLQVCLYFCAHGFTIAFFFQ